MTLPLASPARRNALAALLMAGATLFAVFIPIALLLRGKQLLFPIRNLKLAILRRMKAKTPLPRALRLKALRLRALRLRAL